MYHWAHAPTPYDNFLCYLQQIKAWISIKIIQVLTLAFLLEDVHKLQLQHYSQEQICLMMASAIASAILSSYTFLYFPNWVHFMWGFIVTQICNHLQVFAIIIALCHWHSGTSAGSHQPPETFNNLHCLPDAITHHSLLVTSRGSHKKNEKKFGGRKICKEQNLFKKNGRQNIWQKKLLQKFCGGGVEDKHVQSVTDFISHAASKCVKPNQKNAVTTDVFQVEVATTDHRCRSFRHHIYKKP